MGEAEDIIRNRQQQRIKDELAAKARECRPHLLEALRLAPLAIQRLRELDYPDIPGVGCRFTEIGGHQPATWTMCVNAAQAGEYGQSHRDTILLVSDSTLRTQTTVYPQGKPLTSAYMAYETITAATPYPDAPTMQAVCTKLQLIIDFGRPKPAPTKPPRKRRWWE
jgi:hypothetical protein